MDTMKYLELAVSKDPSRYNLCAIYRDTDCMVATDGYRLHMVTNLAPIDKPHFVNGTDGEFPDYTVVIPKEIQIVGGIKLDKRQLKQLKQYSDFIGKDKVSTMNVNGRLNIEHDQVTDGGFGITLAYTDGLISATITLPMNDYKQGTDKPIGIKANQLYEALVPDTQFAISRGVNEHSPWMLSTLHHNTTAVIMPCRITD